MALWVVFRLLIFPYMFFVYAWQEDIPVWRVPLVIPTHCTLGCLGMLSIQSFWFKAMLKAARRSLAKAGYVEPEPENYEVNLKSSKSDGTWVGNTPRPRNVLQQDSN